MHIWTNSPIDEIWNQLRYLSSPANVANLLTGRVRSGRSTPWPDAGTDDRAIEIASTIRQADEYFQASRGVSLETRPLLQFYGAQSLAKALVLANDQSASLQGLRYHGLSTRATTSLPADRSALQNYADHPATWALENEFAVTNQGVFSALVKALGETPPSTGRVLRFKELVRMVPDLADRYSRHYGEASHCLYLYGDPEVDANGHLTVFFSKRVEPDIFQVFPEFEQGFERTSRHDSPGFRSLQPRGGIDSLGLVQSGTVAGKYLVRRHSTGIGNSMSVLYAAMHILSNVVRYKPAFWMEVVDGRKSGSAAIAEALTHIFATRFPNGTLEHIWHETFTYGGPAYLS